MDDDEPSLVDIDHSQGGDRSDDQEEEMGPSERIMAIHERHETSPTDDTEWRCYCELCTITAIFCRFSTESIACHCDWLSSVTSYYVLLVLLVQSCVASN
jgi:hypothetical protein